MSRALIVVRPEPGNAATVAKARARGLEASGIPLFEIAPVDWRAPDAARFTGLLFTSANGVRRAGPKLADYLRLPACAVGEATADAARAAGFESVIAGDRDVSRLLAKVATLGQHHMLHLSGEDVTPFDAHGIMVDRRIVYAAKALPDPPAFEATIAQWPVVLAHSARAAARLAELIPKAERMRITLVAISEHVAQAAGAGWEEVAVAAHPRDDAMLEVAAALCR